MNDSICFSRFMAVLVIVFTCTAGFAQRTVLTVPAGHLQSPRHIAVSPNGKWMASADVNHVIIWNALNGTQLKNIPLTGRIESLSWFPDNTMLAVQVEDYPMDTIFRFNIQTGLRAGAPIVLKDVYRMKVSGDGKYILASGQNGSIRVLDAATGQLVQTIEADNKKLQLTIYTTPDEQYCAAVNFTKVSVNRLQPGVGGNKKTGEKLFDIKPPFGDILRYQFSPDAKSLITLVGPDFGIVCFDVEQQKVRWSVRSADKSFDDFGFTADGNNIIVLHEGTIEMYALASGAKVGRSIELQKGYGTDMIVSGGMAYLWDEWHQEYRITRYNPITAEKDIVFTGEYQDGDYGGIANAAPVFAQYGSKSPLRIWNFKEGRVINYLQMGEKDKGFGLSPDGATVAYGKPLQVMDARSGKEKMRLPYDIFYSPDGIAISSKEQFICTWEDGENHVIMYDAATRERLWDNKTDKPLQVVFAPDESRVAVLYENGEVRVFDSRSSTLVSTVRPVSDGYPAAGVAFKDNNELIIARGAQISTYAVANGSLVKTNFTLSGGKDPFITSFQLGEDGKTALIETRRGQALLSVVNTVDGSVVCDITGHTAAVYFAGLVAGGKFVVTIAGDDITHIWDAKTGRKLMDLYSYNNEWLAVTPDGRFDGSQEAINKLYFTRGTETIPLQNLYEKYYTPQLISRLYNGEVFEPVADIDEVKQLPVVKLYYTSATRNLLVSDDIASYDNSSGKAEITLKASCEGDAIDEVRLFHNGKIINRTARNLVVADDDKSISTVEKKYLVDLLPGENTFRAVALNTQRTESNPDVIAVVYTPAGVSDTKPVNNTIYDAAIASIDKSATLYLMVVGINAYDNASMKLDYAIADATSFKAAVEKDAKTVISNIQSFFITDKAADRKGILAAFETIQQQARPQDVFMFYYAGHGIIGKDKQFYLVPRDVSSLKNVQEELQQKGISAGQLQQYATDIAAQKQVFILDACQSAGAFENLLSDDANQQRNIALLARSTGTHWMAASGSQQFANEFASLGHGVFTYVLLKALEGEASKDNMITVNGLKYYLQQAVPELMKQYHGSAQYPASFGFGNDFPVEVMK